MANKKRSYGIKETYQQTWTGTWKKEVINEDNTAQVINGCAIWTIIGECILFTIYVGWKWGL